jgi:hypothetical protein
MAAIWLPEFGPDMASLRTRLTAAREELVGWWKLTQPKLEKHRREHAAAFAREQAEIAQQRREAAKLERAEKAKKARKKAAAAKKKATTERRKGPGL